YKPAAVHYHVMRGTVTGTKPGDTVEVWFEGGGKKSDSFTYDMVSDSNRQMLVVAAEDYTGASPAQGVTAPKYAQTFLDSLAANGVAADVYDVDARGRTAPDALGVLSHYKGVIWYTGDDVVTRKAGWAGGNADRLALDEMLEARAFMDEGGRVAYSGKTAGMQYTAAGVGVQYFDPKNEGMCHPNNRDPSWDPRRCFQLRGSVNGGDQINDVLQYWFGGMVQVAGDGQDGTTPYALNGIGNPFDGLAQWSLTSPQPAFPPGGTSSFVTTSGILSPEEYPQFTSNASARWAKPGGPFDPHTGSKYVFSQIADVSYKRLTREIQVPAGGELTFWTSYDTEPDWDYLAVEARTAGQDDWTTLPDANGHTGTSTGLSCPGSTSGWADELHPQLTHYQTYHAGPPATCTSTGTTGEWNAASGNSNGWQQWRIDLSKYAGKTVEISVAYISDWGTQNLGVFLDDFAWPGGSTSFEGTDTGGWQVTGPPPGSGSNTNNFAVTDAGGFPVGAAITTPKSILMGYGFETISTAEQRNAVMGRIASYLLR
ncbi:MAG TPA: zinc carboxypeptidase, partial [Actinomycetes bacterium]|nr:zinc carboxypeptidase [Actinomycetes bacterium]